ATVRGQKSWWRITGELEVGANGEGVLRIENGGTVESSNSYIGHASGSSGAAVVTGVGSIWDLHNGTLFVGNSGTGSLTISDAGAVIAKRVSINNTSKVFLQVSNDNMLSTG